MENSSKSTFYYLRFFNCLTHAPKWGTFLFKKILIDTSNTMIYTIIIKGGKYHGFMWRL
nr:MAG TPA: hypothetical protein [Caudoviricetes sp.]